MNLAPQVRLHLYFARKSSLAVILRQGPTRLFRLILWDREDDTFTDGQWTRNKVYPERCAVSPDGRHFIYFMLDGQWRGAGEGAYTALSQPPYFTALALFPEGSTWAGGGVFLDNRHFIADGGKDIIGRADGLRRVVRGEPAKGCTTGLRLATGGPAPLPREVRDLLLTPDGPVDPQRAGLDAIAQKSLDRYDTQGGCLYRRTPDGLDLIRDFNDMAFEPIRAPYDWREEAEGDPADWHPLDGEGR